jgi:hypothetical protein
MYLIFESQELVSRILPASMHPISREFAAGFLAIAIHLMILLTATNPRLVSSWFVRFYALSAYCITALFFDAFSFTGKGYQQIFSAHLFSILIASINYLVVYLLVGKFQEVKDHRLAQEKLQEVYEILRQKDEQLTAINESQRKLQQELNHHYEQLTVTQQQNRALHEDLRLFEEKLTVREEAFTKLDGTHQHTHAQWKETQTELRKLNDFLLEHKLMCSHCHEVFKNVNAYSRHQRDCKVLKAQTNGQLIKK